MSVTEFLIEEAILSWLASLGYTSIFGPDIAPEEPAAERESFLEFLLTRRLNQASQSGALQKAMCEVRQLDAWIHSRPMGLVSVNHIFFKDMPFSKLASEQKSRLISFEVPINCSKKTAERAT